MKKHRIMLFPIRIPKKTTIQYIYYSLGILVFFVFVLYWANFYSRDQIDSLVYSRLRLPNTTVTNEISSNLSKHYTTKNESLKYILVWTSPKRSPIANLGNGQKTFFRKKCLVNDCYSTSNRTLFSSITQFDVIVFHVPEIFNKRDLILPNARSPHQLYVFASMESADNNPLCNNKFDDYFNLTWTYKLNSDIIFGYMIIRNKTGDIIGPNQIMHWMKVEDMDPIDEEIKNKLQHKSIAAAWFVSHCNAASGRDNFVKEVQRELDKYKLTIDIYGKCGSKQCLRGEMKNCLERIEKDYYFYFSFENSFCEDYVTEKLLHALNHYALPVVFGTANYTRFMPDGIYLNAFKLGPKELARQMADIINDKERYYSFFKWHNHYTYQDDEEGPEADPFCKLCEKVNDEKVFKGTNSYVRLKDWWNPKKITRKSVCAVRK